MSAVRTSSSFPSPATEITERLAATLDQWASRRDDRAGLAAKQAACWLRERDGAPAGPVVSQLVDLLLASADAASREAMACARERNFGGVASAVSHAVACLLCADVVLRGPTAPPPARPPTWSLSLPPVSASPREETLRAATGAPAAPQWLYSATAPLPPLAGPLPEPWSGGPPYSAPSATSGGRRAHHTAPLNTPTIPQFLNTQDTPTIPDFPDAGDGR
jgi:hypothetical protein